MVADMREDTIQCQRIAFGGMTGRHWKLLFVQAWDVPCVVTSRDLVLQQMT